jgi:23S rRNA (guanosine2251-2'-O)-methyltransferase
MPVYIFGFHAVEELLKKGGIDGSLYYSKKSKKCMDLVLLAQNKGLDTSYKHDDELSRLCGNNDHRGVLLALKELPYTFQHDLKSVLRTIQSSRALVVILDNITDPHNFGAILRSCDQFAVDLVIIPKRKAAGETQTVLKTSAGASSFVNVISVANLSNAIEILKKERFWIYGADIQGRSLDKTDLSGRVALILGSEGKGLRHLLKQTSDELIAIPAKGHIDSFNVSVAAGIMFYEVRRQQDWFGETISQA